MKVVSTRWKLTIKTEKIAENLVFPLLRSSYPGSQLERTGEKRATNIFRCQTLPPILKKRKCIEKLNKIRRKKTPILWEKPVQPARLGKGQTYLLHYNYKIFWIYSITDQYEYYLLDFCYQPVRFVRKVVLILIIDIPSVEVDRLVTESV